MRKTGKRLRTSLRGIANRAQIDERHRFGSLYGLLDEEALTDTWRSLNKRAASGVDRVTARDYASDLDGNVERLVERLKRKQYRAKLVRRKHIPKDGGSGKRPLGIPVLEDRLLQLTVARILEAIYDPQFLDCNYAYREKRGAHLAVSDLTQELQFGCYGHVVDVDIKGFFDNISHDKLMEILEHRINDRPFLCLIRKWLKAGVLEEDGKVRHPATGCPQGGCISPILANIYLDYVLDQWFVREIKPKCRARAYMSRYADDIVYAFQYQREAEMLFRELPKRLGRFNLELSAEKTRVVRFSRFSVIDGEESLSFVYLGFEFRWMRDRKGIPRMKRRTARKRFRRSLTRLTEWIRRERDRPVRDLMKTLSRKLLGYYNYYGVRSNAESLWAYHREALKIVRKWLNRRSQRRSYSWRGFHAMVKYFGVARPRITEYRNRQRMLVYAT